MRAIIRTVRAGCTRAHPLSSTAAVRADFGLEPVRRGCAAPAQHHTTMCAHRRPPAARTAGHTPNAWSLIDPRSSTRSDGLVLPTGFIAPPHPRARACAHLIASLAAVRSRLAPLLSARAVPSPCPPACACRCAPSRPSSSPATPRSQRPGGAHAVRQSFAQFRV